jgi:hypothetical protein
LLGFRPVTSQTNLSLLDRVEQSLGIRLPLSFREWYRYEGSVEILRQHSNQDHPAPLEKLGQAPFELKNGLLCFMYENQGVCSWEIRLDGSDDPSVIVNLSFCAPAEAEAERYIYVERFTDFVYTQIWDWQYWDDDHFLCSIEKGLNRKQLIYLRHHFDEGPITYHWPASVTYRFSRRDWRLKFSEGDWFAWAPSKESLLELLRFLDRGGIHFTGNEMNHHVGAEWALQQLFKSSDQIHNR